MKRCRICGEEILYKRWVAPGGMPQEGWCLVAGRSRICMKLPGSAYNELHMPEKEPTGRCARHAGLHARTDECQRFISLDFANALGIDDPDDQRGAT